MTRLTLAACLLLACSTTTPPPKPTLVEDAAPPEPPVARPALPSRSATLPQLGVPDANDRAFDPDRDALPADIPMAVEPPLEALGEGPEVPELREARAALAGGEPARAEELAIAADREAPHVKLAALALVGRIEARAGKSDAYRQLLDEHAEHDIAAWAPPAQAVALDAIAEALVHFAEQKRARAIATPPPRYRGPGDRASVEQFLVNEARGWLEAMRTAESDVEQAYAAVGRLEPEPPARWVVVAGLRLGTMHAAFARAIRAIPYPREWDRVGFIPGVDPPLMWTEVRGFYQGALVECSRPQIQRARHAFKTCAAWAEAFAIDGPFAKSCNDWLSQDPR